MKKKTRITLLRSVLGALILLNMIMIFLFSAQNGTESDKTSGEISKVVAEVTVKDFESKTEAEQNEIIQSINPPLRKIAHMSEFGSLGALIFLFLLTWKGRVLWRYFTSLGATFLYACSDEFHQMSTEARGPRFTDVLIDLSGALICCTVILLCLLLFRKIWKGKRAPSMQVSHYYPEIKQANFKLRIAVASDLHGEPHEKLVEKIKNESPDLILIPGDLMDDKDLEDEQASGYAFLRECTAIAPTYYSLGNHEIACYHKGNPWRHPTPIPLSKEIKERIHKTGAILLDNRCVRHGNLTICGLTSGINGKKNEPNRAVLKSFAKQSGFRILLCHHPEYFMPYIKETDIELTVCGHAHGGQWRFFGRGVYAPGQGLFPKYTSGMLESRCVISRGLGNHTLYPRFFNPRELVIIHYGETKEKEK